MKKEKELEYMMDFRMRSIYLTLILLVFGAFCKAEIYFNPVCAINFELFCSELRAFIKLSKEEAPFHGEHNVYLVKFEESNILEACITMEYIFSRNRYMQKLEGFDYFTLLDSNLVLINLSEKFRNKYDFRDGRIQILTDTTVITKKLYQGVFFGDGSAAVSCFGQKNVVRKIYQDDSFLPDDKRLFEIKNVGILRIIDSTTFKKKQKNK